MGIENDLSFVWGSRLTSSLYAGRKSLGFSVGLEINLVVVWVVEIDLVSVWGIKHDLLSE